MTLRIMIMMNKYPYNYDSKIGLKGTNERQMLLMKRCYPPDSRDRPIWAPARAPDFHFDIHQVVTSTNNSTQHTKKVSRRMHLPDGLSARALKHLVPGKGPDLHSNIHKLILELPRIIKIYQELPSYNSTQCTI